MKEKGSPVFVSPSRWRSFHCVTWFLVVPVFINDVLIVLLLVLSSNHELLKSMQSDHVTHRVNYYEGEGKYVSFNLPSLDRVYTLIVSLGKHRRLC